MNNVKDFKVDSRNQLGRSATTLVGMDEESHKSVAKIGQQNDHIQKRPPAY
jgi:hypothetical protein